jgi:hypothetical protein
MFMLPMGFATLMLIAILVLVFGMRRSGHGELPPGLMDELRRLREAVSDLGERVDRVEEEREFDKKLMESLAKHELPPGETVEEEES